MARLMLIDGNSLTYRAFFALPTDMATASGQVTNAVFGFTSMLVNLIKDHHPDQLVATFDRPEPTFRHEMIAGYKAGRSAAPDILRQQMGLVRQLVETLHVPVVDLSGYEADDVIATLATDAAARGDDVIIVTGDRDTYQLVEDPHVKVLYNRRGVSDYVLYDEAGIEERTGVTPALYPQYAALRGDPSDNLPGVPGVGEKTAAKLINTYGDLDGVYAHLSELSPKLRQSLADAEPTVRANADRDAARARPAGLGGPGGGRARGLGSRGDPAPVRLPRVPHPVGPIPRGDGRRRAGRSGRDPGRDGDRRRRAGGAGRQAGCRCDRRLVGRGYGAGGRRGVGRARGALEAARAGVGGPARG